MEMWLGDILVPQMILLAIYLFLLVVPGAENAL
jgi:hypothetical protein